MEKIRVFLVDDNKILLDNLVETVAKETDIEVVGCAMSGASCIEQCRACKPEIVVMDIEMEDRTSGIEAAKQILNEGTAEKIIFHTVHFDDDTVIEALGTGSVDYVIKSADCNELIKHIRKIHKNIIEMDSIIQKILHDEYLKLTHSSQDNLSFIKDLMKLTSAERIVVSYLLQGKSINDISRLRFVEISTVKKQIGQILKKIKLKRTKQLCERINELQITSLFDITE